VIERRVYQRLNLTKPLDGSYGDLPVRIVDVSATGAQVELSERTLPPRGRLRFRWREQVVEIESEVVRSDEDRAGIHFVEESETLRDLIAQSATEVLAAQQANMEGDRARNVIATDDVGEETLTAASAGLGAKGWTMFTLGPNGWKRRRSMLPDQPEHGFTVSAAEPDDQVELLCQTYEHGDEEARRMTRLLAELSAASVPIR
jgi:hypothetical protein